MRLLIFISILLSSCINNKSDDNIFCINASSVKDYGADEYGIKKYVIAFLKEGPNRDISKEEAIKLQTAHLKNIEKLAEEKKLVVAGPFLDRGELKGIYIFNVTTIEEAKQLTNTDPAIQSGSLVMELKEWYSSAALMSVNDIHNILSSKNISE